MGASFPITTSIKRLANWTRTSQGEIYRRERDEFIIRTLGTLFAGIGEEKRPQTAYRCSATHSRLGFRTL